MATSAWRWEIGSELRTPGVLAYVWIRHFPMFKWDAEGKRWDATHNPFSAPVWEEEDRLESDPGSIRAQQYDLVLNGWEAGGGSIRIHRRDLLERAFALMGHSMESARDQFGALLDALEYGAPPHGGIAIGLDRWAALYAEVDNIREVMAFPKTQSGTDLMLDAPSPIAEAQLDELGLQIAERDASRRRAAEAAGFVVGLAAGEGRVEDADQPQVGFHPHDVAVVGVQRVHGARHDRVTLTGGQVLDLTLALDAVARLEMVGVLHLLLPARLDHGVVQREAHGVALQQEAAAAPALAGHVALRADHLVEGANDHAAPPSVLRSILEVNPWGRSVRRKGSPVGCGIIDLP